MELKLLFPCDYFDKSAIDEAYSEEYAIAKSLGFDIILFDYDKFIQTSKINVSASKDGCFLLYRGWMLNVNKYYLLQCQLQDNGYNLLTPSGLYQSTHHFDEIYYYIKDKIETPKSVVIQFDNQWKYFDPDIGWLPLDLKYVFKDYFIMKDNVKSVKGTDFPTKISVNISDEELKELVEKFEKYRSDLFTGEIVLKQYVELKKYGDTTNEWRVFYFLENVMTVSRNSNQPENCPKVPDSLINNKSLTRLTSFFYTIDFAETEDGKWIVIETGDGQVSGLSPNQNILEFYTKIQNYWNQKYNN